MSDVSTISKVDVAEKIAMKPPLRWNVILYNDDKTPMEFVILILMQVYYKNFQDSSDIMMHIHENGKGIAGTYSFEVASQKKDETITIARTNGHPLRVEIESVEE